MRSVVRNSGFSLKLLLLAGVFAFVSVSLSAAAAEQRVALVIGNDAYPAAPLKNPVNDARAIAKSLNRLGFEVILRTNLNQKGMVEVLREFGGRLREGGVALFYYSGHGMQVKGRNYLIPVNSDIRSEDEVPYMSIDMAQVLDKIEAARSRANLVILDACRNNPFVRTFRSGRVGLAQMDAPGGTLLAFATAPGGVARDGNEENGIYTKHLLAQMNTPRLPVEVMFRRVREGVTAETNNTQTPWESSSLTGDFYFNQTAPAPEQAPPLATAIPGPQPAAPAARVDPLAVELAFWNSIKDSSNPADYTAYLEQYPAGSFAGIARNRTGSTAAAQAPPPVAAEPAPPTPPPATKGLNVASRAPSSAATRSRPTAVQVGDTWTYRLTDVRWNRNNATVVHEVLAVDAKSVTENLRLPTSRSSKFRNRRHSTRGYWCITSRLISSSPNLHRFLPPSKPWKPVNPGRTFPASSILQHLTAGGSAPRSWRGKKCACRPVNSMPSKSRSMPSDPIRPRLFCRAMSRASKCSRGMPRRPGAWSKSST
jgi:hypothetical protein